MEATNIQYNIEPYKRSATILFYQPQQAAVNCVMTVCKSDLALYAVSAYLGYQIPLDILSQTDYCEIDQACN